MQRGIIWKSDTGLRFNLFRLACYGLILMVLLGFAGGLTPVGDSLAVFRRELALLCAVFGLIAFGCGKLRIPALALFASILAAVSIHPWIDQPDEVSSTFTLRQHNVFFDNPDMPSLFEAAKTSGADVLTFQEVGTKTRRMLDGVSEIYSHFQHCFYGSGGVAVMAKDLGPMVGHGCAQKGKVAWIRLHTDVGPVTFAAIHQLWPWPNGQYWQSERLAQELKNIPQPVIMAGDFNMVPWSSTTKLLAEAIDGKLATGLDPTFEIASGLLSLRIDNVVVPKLARVRVTTQPKLGSDHAALWAVIEMPAEKSP